jgi:hypothetical protein
LSASSVGYVVPLEREVRKADAIDATAAVATWTQQRRIYREILRQKRESFWRMKVDGRRSSPRQLWKFIDTLMSRGRIPVCSSIMADDFHRYFNDKVDGVRASTAGALPASFTAVSQQLRDVRIHAAVRR